MKLKSFRASMGNPRDHGKVNILLSRNDVLNTSYTAIMNLKGEELQKIPYISFHGEKGTATSMCFGPFLTGFPAMCHLTRAV